jgi:hypothetical protein
LIAGTDKAVFASRPGWPGQRRLASTGGPRPPASRGGGGKSRSSGQQAWRRQRESASKEGGALRPHVFWVEYVPSAPVYDCESRHDCCAAVLRAASVHSERELRKGPLRVAWRPSNHSLHRTPPRAVCPATSFGAREARCRRRGRRWGGAGEFQQRSAATSVA